MVKQIIACLLTGIVFATAPVVTTFHYKNEYESLQQSESVQDSSGLVSLIDELNLENKNLKSELEELNASYNVAISQNDANAVEIANLKTQINTLNNEIQQLNKDISDLNDELLEKEKELESKDLTIEEKQSLIATYSARIESLESDLLVKQNEITRLNGLIEDYNEIKNGTREVNFYVGENLLHTDAITNGQCVESTPSSTEFIVISGWLLEDGTEVDPLTHPITKNTNFYAVYIQYHTATFMNGSENIGTMKVQENTTFSIDTIAQPTTDEEMQEFKGWAIQGTTNIIDFTSHTISEDTIYIAIFGKIEEESNLYEFNFVTGQIKNVSSKSVTPEYIESNNFTNELYQNLTYKWEHTQPYYIKVWATGLLGSSEKEVSIDIANGKFEYITENCGNVRDCKTVVEFTGEDIYFSALSWDITIKISSNGELEVVSNLKNITTMLVEIVYDYDDL